MLNQTTPMFLRQADLVIIDSDRLGDEKCGEWEDYGTQDIFRIPVLERIAENIYFTG
ncbi:hypothetical protein ACFQI7_00375 [Paenibacillus allorhizosphaerae]|uniref:Uncharacterized protein n=1 Tax=Paenibacillus allorhizosphaerae TaxID=2849866 RepID=A0ABM8V9P8_9BACL|nr:hypothetical protein [Paenibacillus allorhizosphaerae]CAG7613962.1 hypothetical protein PAECIP111802_00030 [Paenibacillus allorhizosphaerae]